jgi:uncharacterized protein (TIGR02246 family)
MQKAPILALAVLVTALAPAALAQEADEQALLELSRIWARAAATGDVDLILSFWADDAVVLPPGRPALAGKAAIREFVAATLAVPGASITWEPESVTVAPGGDLAYLIERNRVTLPDASGELTTIAGKAVTIWRKDAEGSWRCVVDIWNEAAAEAAPPDGGPVP